MLAVSWGLKEAVLSLHLFLTPLLPSTRRRVHFPESMVRLLIGHTCMSVQKSLRYFCQHNECHFSLLVMTSIFLYSFRLFCLQRILAVHPCSVLWHMLSRVNQEHLYFPHIHIALLSHFSSCSHYLITESCFHIIS